MHTGTSSVCIGRTCLHILVLCTACRDAVRQRMLEVRRSPVPDDDPIRTIMPNLVQNSGQVCKLHAPYMHSYMYVPWMCRFVLLRKCTYMHTCTCAVYVCIILLANGKQRFLNQFEIT